jgi:translation initiation factor IF-3
MDYGKFKYRESKKQHEARLKQKQIVVKEVKFRPGTDEGDYKIKLRNLTRFLEEGDKTKITLRFRGREMAHQEFGMRLLERVKGDLDAYGVVEQFPKMEGRQLVMVLAPKKKVVPVKGAPAKVSPEAGVNPAAAKTAAASEAVKPAAASEAVKPAAASEVVKPAATPEKVVVAETAATGDKK